jgi:hypothetical protein
MRITQSGNVGIANTTPDARLAVTGTANVSGNVVIGGSLNAANVTAALFTGNVTGTSSNATNLNSQPGSFYTNATNITTGTLPWAQAPSGTVNATGAFTISGIYTHTANIVVGNTTVNSQYSNAIILISNSTSTTTLGLAALRIGNTTTNVVISNTTSTFSGNVAITGSANAANVTAALFTGNVTGTSSNATNLNSQPGSFYTNATNLATGTVPTARLATGTANSTTFLRGDQTWAPITSGGSGLFNTSLTSSIGFAANSTLSPAFTAPGTAGLRYIVYSIHVTNIGSANSGVTAKINGSTYANVSLATTVPLPVESAVELLKMPKVMQPSDVLSVQVQDNTPLHVTITYETQTSTNLFGAGVDITADATYTDLYTASGNAVIQSVLLSNDNGVNDVKARVVWTDGSNNIQGYYCYDLIIPADATVEILEQAKYLPNGFKIRVYANVGNRLEAMVAGRLI